ncbi:hypothetical protein [Haemophilus haemolyticus]|uniref:hypothetical protein n=1 Tax=Haemophilus haemolyticus TaxID=726 RepID=UPI000E57ADBA|nr:hypothetical protein [Haemophilus haemolyticus]
MRKNIFILITIFIISGCYSTETDCYYGMTTICFGESYSPVAKFQKSYSLGYTDPKQRWDDLVSCGVKLGDVTLHSAWRKALEPLNKELLEKLSAKFRACMKNKGYITIDSCGRKNSTTDKGLCNE